MGRIESEFDPGARHCCPPGEMGFLWGMFLGLLVGLVGGSDAEASHDGGPGVHASLQGVHLAVQPPFQRGRGLNERDFLARLIRLQLHDANPIERLHRFPPAERARVASARPRPGGHGAGPR